MVPASRWSDFDYFAYASVQVSETDSGARLNVHSLYRDTRSVGLRNFLSWRVDGWQYDTDYTVRVSNVRLPVMTASAGMTVAPGAGKGLDLVII